MKRLIFFLCAMTFYLIPLFAQAPDTLWTKTYGRPDRDEGLCVQQTSDSGYIIAGGVTHFNNDVNVHLIKTDINGNLLWEKSIGGMEYDEGNCVRETFDGGYIIAGYTRSEELIFFALIFS